VNREKRIVKIKMTDQSKYEKLEDTEEKEETNFIVDDNITHSISENKFDWDFILDREWSKTKK
jgi:hypothetical protein